VSVCKCSWNAVVVQMSMKVRYVCVCVFACACVCVCVCMCVSVRVMRLLRRCLDVQRGFVKRGVLAVMRCMCIYIHDVMSCVCIYTTPNIYTHTTHNISMCIRMHGCYELCVYIYTYIHICTCTYIYIYV